MFSPTGSSQRSPVYHKASLACVSFGHYRRASLSLALRTRFRLALSLTLGSPSSYMIDAYERNAASAIAANVVMRSLAGAAFPIFAQAMFRKVSSTLVLFLTSRKSL